MTLFESLLNLIEALVQLLAALAHLIAPWWPLIAWIAFWTLAVDWTRLRQFLVSGGWIGLLLIALMMVLVWGVVAPPSGGYHYLLGLHVTNFVGKTMYVTGLLVIMLLCGSVQLSGAVDRLLRLDEPATESEHDEHHAHSAHAGNGAAHGH